MTHLSISQEVRKDVEANEVKRLAVGFAISARSNPYPTKKDLQSWLFSSRKHLAAKVWEKYRQMVC